MKYGHWEGVKATVDSSAFRSAMFEHVASVYIVEGKILLKWNANFLEANDNVINIQGESQVEVVDDKCKPISMHFQFADVSKILALIGALDASGHVTVFGNNK